MKELLLEIFSEEIPARMQKNGVGDFASMLLEEMQKIFVTFEQKSEDIITYVTPRRIAVLIKNLDLESNKNKKAPPMQEIKGPRIGANQTAIDGFINKYNIKDTSELLQKDGYFFYTKALECDILKMLKKAIEATLCNFTWPKSMYWCESRIRWIRPIHSILCIFDNKVLPVRFGHIQAGRETQGHRFLAPKKITIHSASEYAAKLSAAYVICDPTQRRNIILREINKQLSNLKLELLEDNELLEELVGLTEYPVVLLGTIDQEFMSLPREVLVTVLRTHQKFLLTTYDSGDIAPYFIIISNIKTKDENHIISGNMRVLKARLTDAQFFINKDQKITLEQRLSDLHKLNFHHKIGSMYEKAMRMVNLASQMAKDNDGINIELAKRSALLMKCDLTTDIVAEFPELQGIIGGYYAAYDGEVSEISVAIRDHYKPQGPNDDLPTTKLGAVVAIADKLDTLNSMFKHNIKPTGSKDPYALRRAALGIIRIVSKHNLRLHLTARHDIDEEVVEFIKERVYHWHSTKNDKNLTTMILDAIG